MLKLSALVRLLKPWSCSRGRGLTTSVTSKKPACRAKGADYGATPLPFKPLWRLGFRLRICPPRGKEFAIRCENRRMGAVSQRADRVLAFRSPEVLRRGLEGLRGSASEDCRFPLFVAASHQQG